METYCCKKPVKKGKEMEHGKTVVGIWCDTCGKKGKGSTEDAALTAFKASKPVASSTQGAAPKAAQPATPAAALALPTKPAELGPYITSRLGEIAALSAAYIDRPALAQMVRRNVRYVVNNKAPAFLKLWETPEGQSSIIEQLEEAFSMGATLPEMGNLVPFGTVCEFIPAVECFDFALTQGKSAPFKWIRIEPVYQHDQVTVSRTNGEFKVEFKAILPERGEIKAVAVYGELAKTGKIVGEMYAADRLLEKAEAHSAGYQAYLRNINLFERARTEGTVKVDAEGREYADVMVESKDAGKYADQNRANFDVAEKAGKLKKDGKGEYAEVELPKRDGSTWTKKIYRAEIESPGTQMKRLYLEEIVNPYVGPDRPEMLKKCAGKSFLYPYMKVRNSVAAMDETRKNPENIDDALESALDQALRQFEGGGADAEPVDFTVEGAEPGDAKGEGAVPHPENNPRPQTTGGAEPQKGETADGATKTKDRPAKDAQPVEGQKPKEGEAAKKKPEF